MSENLKQHLIYQMFWRNVIQWRGYEYLENIKNLVNLVVWLFCVLGCKLIEKILNSNLYFLSFYFRQCFFTGNRKSSYPPNRLLLCLFYPTGSAEDSLAPTESVSLPTTSQLPNLWLKWHSDWLMVFSFEELQELEYQILTSTYLTWPLYWLMVSSFEDVTLKTYLNLPKYSNCYNGIQAGLWSRPCY